MKNLFITLIIICFASKLSGQAILHGTITDINGESLIGATIYPKIDPSKGTITDFDGKYSLKLSGTSPQVIVIKYISYQEQEHNIEFTKEKDILFNVVLTPTTELIDEVVVRGKMDRSKEEVMRTLQMKSIESFDYISKETIAKTGDSDVKDAMKRVTGVSTVNNFITVRGLNDRYIVTTINSARIPTLDPLTNNISLDIFPTNLIDNVVIKKTQSPELPGDWAGAYIDIETRSYPEKLLIFAKSSFGYNTQTTFNTVPASQKSPTDWLGFDNGFRDLGGQYTEETFPWYNGRQAAATGEMWGYDEFNSLGLGDYYNSISLDPALLPGYETASNKFDNIYYRLSLVELGFLAPALIDNYDAFLAAEASYAGSSQKKQAFVNVNSPNADFGSAMPSFFTIERKAPLMFSQEFAVGNRTSLFNKPLGFMFGLKYTSTVESLIYKEANIYAGDTKSIFEEIDDREETRETNYWSALISLTSNPHPFHSIKVMFMPNLWGQNRARTEDEAFETPYIQAGTPISHKQNYEERSQLIWQLGTSHFFPVTRIKLQSDFSFTLGKSSLPDIRSISAEQLEYQTPEPTQGWFTFGSVPDAYREFRYLKDNIFDAGLHFEIPISQSSLNRKFKVGVAYQNNKASNESFLYNILLANGTTEFPDYFEYMAPEKFTIQDSLSIPLHFDFGSNGIIEGSREIKSAYAMLEYAIIEPLSISGGLRIEKSEILNIATHSQTSINQLDYLPSINVLYKIADTEKHVFNGRLSYGKSLARPSDKEIPAWYHYDLEYDNYITGNPDLKISEINNYDIRFEAFFANDDFFSISGFYKDFKNPITILRKVTGYTWVNADDSRLYGLELEGKKSIIKNLSFNANFTYVYARSTLTYTEIPGSPDITRDEPMFGQAPYVVNALIDYSIPEIKTALSLAYNVQGPKIATVGFADYPNLMELARKTLDFKISKTIGKHWAAELRIRNILNAPVNWRYDDQVPDWRTAPESLKIKSMWKDAFGLNIGEYPFKWGPAEKMYTTGVNFLLGISYNF